MSISEAYFAFFKKKEEQKRIKDELNKFIIQALRSSHSRTDVEQYKDIPIVIEKKLDKELTMLDSNIDRVLKTAVQIPHNGEVHRNGIIFRSKLVLRTNPMRLLYQQLIGILGRIFLKVKI